MSEAPLVRIHDVNKYYGQNHVLKTLTSPSIRAKSLSCSALPVPAINPVPNHYAEQLTGRAAPEAAKVRTSSGISRPMRHADGQADAAEDNPVQVGASEGQVQKKDGVAADEAEEHLADAEDDRWCGAEAVDQQRADPHAEQGDAGGEAEAEDGVTQEVGGRRTQE